MDPACTEQMAGASKIAKTTPRNADVIVHSRLQPANGDPVTFNYLMRGSGADWKIEDVYLDGTISQLATQRSEFQSILRRQGVDGLISALDHKVGLLTSSMARSQ